MRSSAVEYGNKGIQINCLAPGFVESSYADSFKKNNKELYEWTISQTPMRRWGKCEEQIYFFLISEKNSYMTGTVIYSDGVGLQSNMKNVIGLILQDLDQKDYRAKH